MTETAPSVDAVRWAVHRTIAMHRTDESGQAGCCAYCRRGQTEPCPALAEAKAWQRAASVPAGPARDQTGIG